MFLKSLTLSNILSFGPEPHTVDLAPLNVIIGPNGSGKSNFIEAIGLLKAAPRDIREPIRVGGGIAEWLWKGEHGTGVATLEARAIDSVTADEPSPHRDLLSYRVSFEAVGQRFVIRDEDLSVLTQEDASRRLPYFEVRNGRLRREDHDTHEINRLIDLDRSSSFLSQLVPPFIDKEIFDFSKNIAAFQILKEFDVGKSSPVRLPQKTDLPNGFLAQDGGNLGLILNRLRGDAKVRRTMREVLQSLYDNVEDIDVQVEGGTVQTFIHEGDMAISASRLSSGTLRFLCLLAVLLHPEPPPLICIEEPELGLHPDLIPTVSRLLKEASERTQVLVTTHSDILVDTMTDRPEAVLVAEKGEGGTRLTRLDPEQMKPWLVKYRLGDLWTRGDIGGTRW